MPNTIEVEVRGLLSKSEARQLERFLSDNGLYQGIKKRLTIDYSFYLPEGGVERREKDIRLRVTNGLPEFIIKLGKWGAGENRKELSVKTNTGDFPTLVNMLTHLGLEKGMAFVRISKVYIYKEIEFSIVEVPGHSYYYEAEQLVSTKKDANKASSIIENACKDLDLTVFNNQEFLDYVTLLNEESNQEFNAQDVKGVDYFKKRFGIEIE